MPMTRLALRCIEYPAPDYLLAEACHISPSKFSLMQQGKMKLQIEYAIRLAQIFQVEVIDVLGWADEDSDYFILDDCVAVA